MEEGILKIASDPQEFQKGLYDKIYYGIDKTLWKYLFDNTNKIAVIPPVPNDVDEIVKESTAMDNKNQELKQLYDSIIYAGMFNNWLIGVTESQYFSQAPTAIAAEVLKKAKSIADKQFAHYKSRGEDIFYHFEYRNKDLIEQFSVSSAICIDSRWTPFYRYKFGDFRVKNAETYLSGLDVVVPLMTKIGLHDLTFDEILRLRKNKSWNNAMDQFGDLCFAATTEDNKDFKQKITEEVLMKCLDAYKEEGNYA